MDCSLVEVVIVAAVVVFEGCVVNATSAVEVAVFALALKEAWLPAVNNSVEGCTGVEVLSHDDRMRHCCNVGGAVRGSCSEAGRAHTEASAASESAGEA